MDYSLQDYIKKIKQRSKELNDFINKDAPIVAADVAVMLFKKNFQAEGFFDTPWKKRKNPKQSASGKHGKNSSQIDSGFHKILTDTGHLGRSIKKKLINPKEAEVYSNASYAYYHNEGTKRLPQRQFLGLHPMLISRINLAIKKGLDIVLKN